MGCEGRGSVWNPSALQSLFPIPFCGAVNYGGPGESLASFGVLYPLLSSLLWFRPSGGLAAVPSRLQEWPGAPQSAWNRGLGCGRDKAAGCQH